MPAEVHVRAARGRLGVTRTAGACPQGGVPCVQVGGRGESSLGCTALVAWAGQPPTAPQASCLQAVGRGRRLARTCRCEGPGIGVGRPSASQGSCGLGDVRGAAGSVPGHAASGPVLRRQPLHPQLHPDTGAANRRAYKAERAGEGEGRAWYLQPWQLRGLARRCPVSRAWWWFRV